MSNPSSIHHMQYAPTYKLQLQLLSLWSWLLHKSGNSAGVVLRDCSLQWLQCAARADKEPRCCRHMQPGAACSSAPGLGLQICLLNFWQLLHTSNTTSFVRVSSYNKTFFCLFCSHWSINRHLVALFRRSLGVETSSRQALKTALCIAKLQFTAKLQHSPCYQHKVVTITIILVASLHHTTRV